MKRSAAQDLKHWFSKESRMPLIIRGARQVGKSTLVRLFSTENNLDLIEINLERRKISSVEKDDFSISAIIDEIQLKTNKSIHSKSLIFFDEIQEQPSLLKALRYFYEERPELAIIAAGSLLEIALRDENFSFPVGRVEFYNLGPMTFKEFLWATNQEMLAEKLEKSEYSDTVDRLARESLKNYFYVGGMPKAVDTFAKENSLVNVRALQDQILQTYSADFPKYNSRINVQRIDRVFNSVAVNLGKKVIYTKIDPDSQARETKKVVDLLIQARVLLECVHSDGNTVPLAGESDSSVRKLYFIDVGLMNSLLRLDLEVITNVVDKKFNTKGIMAEQFVAQHLAFFEGNEKLPSLYYWLRDKGSQKGELDFLVQNGQTIYPVEVKSVNSGQMKSAFYFAKEKKLNQVVKLSMGDYKTETVKHRIGEDDIEMKVLDLPLYSVEFLKNVL